MYQQIWTRLALSGNNASEVSQPVSMQGANAAQLDVVVLSMAGTSPSVALVLQESSDLENWSNKTTFSSVTATGYTLFAATTAISAGYIRVKATFTGSSSPVAVLSAGINTAHL